MPGTGIWNSSGNVGIGTTSPDQKFAILGTIGNPATSGSTQNGIMRITNTNDFSVLDIGMRGVTSGVWLQSTNRSDLSLNNPLLLNPNGGNVGIGTTNPLAALSVGSTSQFQVNSTGAIAAATGITSSGTITLSGITGDGLYANVDYTNPNSDTTGVLMNLRPTYTGSAAMNFSGDAAQIYPIINTGRSNMGYIRGYSSTVLRNSNGAGADDSGTLATLEGLYSVYGHLNTNAAATPQTQDAFGLAIFPYYMTGTIQRMYDIYLGADTGGGTVTNRWGIYQQNTANNYFAGNVGIGTTTPGSYKLNVTGGDIYGSGNLALAGTTGITLSGAGADLIFSGTGPNQITTASGVNLALMPGGSGNVGIGTTSPYSNLDVSSTTGGASTLSRNDTAVTAGDIIGQLSFHTNDTQTTTNPLAAQIGAIAKSTIATDVNPGILTFSTTPSTVGAALAERMRIDETGNVGIGTTNPVEVLDVNGRVHLTQTSAPSPTTDRLYNVSGNLLWNGISLTGGGSLPSGTAGQTIYNNASTWAATSNLYNNGTNVGIGTTSPAYKFDVFGQASTGSYVARIYNDYVTAANGLLINNGDSNDDLALRVSNRTNTLDSLVVTGTGNVGIGTTNPGAKLDLAGNFRLTQSSDAYNQALQIKSSLGNSGYIWNDGTQLRLSMGSGEGGNIILNGGGTGNVGIGTTAPDQLLAVQGASGLSGATPVSLKLNSTSDGTWTNGSIASQILFSSSDVSGTAGTRGAIKSYVGNTTGAYFGLSFWTTINGATGIQERMRIAQNGYVGIDTANPQQRLTLGSGDNFATEMASPIGVSASPVSGGTLSAGTYYYVIAASDGVGYTTASAETSCTVDGSTTGSCNITWSAVTGATTYRVFGRTQGSENLYQSVSSTTYLDDNSVMTGGSLPAATTAYVNKISASGDSWINSGSLGLGMANPAYDLDITAISSRAINITQPNAGSGIRINSTSITGTNYGFYATLGSSGTGATTNEGGYFDAENATTNYGGYFKAGGGTSGNTDVYAAAIDSSGATATYGFYAGVMSGTGTNVYGMYVAGPSATGTGAYGAKIVAPSGAATSSYTLNITQPTAATHNAALEIGTASAAAGTWSIYSSSTSPSYFSGNVGIGTTSPYSNLDVSSTTGGALTLSRNDISVTAGDTIGQINFWTEDTSTATNPLAAQISVIAKSTIGTDINPGILTFSTTPSAVGAALVERMRIDETGNVGIGTTNPGSYNLQVNGTGGFSTSANSPIFQGQAAAVTFGNASYNTALTSNVWGITAPGVASGLTAITSSGNITLSGLTANRFVTSGTGGLLGTSGTLANLVASISDVTSSTGTTNLVLSGSPTFTGSVTMPGTGIWNSSGNVGIGTTTPGSYKLNVTGGDIYGSGNLALAGTTGITLSGAGADLIFSGTGPNQITTASGVNLALMPGGAGNVGIGTTAPGRPLEVNGYIRADYNGGSGGLVVQNAGGSEGLYITSDASNNMHINNPGGTILSLDTNSNSCIAITSGGNVGIGTTSPAGLLDVNGKLTVLSGGNVGIGTTSPLAQLHVSGGNILLDNNYSISGLNTTGSGVVMLENNSSNSTLLNAASGQNIVFGIATAEKMRVDLNGNVGIGTTAPDSSTQIYFTGGSKTGLHVTDNVASADTLLKLDDTNGAIASGSYFLRATAGTSTDRFFVKGDGTGYFAGNVGIGTTAPGYALTIAGGSIGLDNNKYLVQRDAAGGAYRNVIGFDSSDNLNIYNNTGNDGGNIIFNNKSGAGESMRIDVNGNVGIGTTSPGSALQIGDINKSDRMLYLGSAGNTYLTLETIGSTGEGRTTLGNAAAGSSFLTFYTSNAGTEGEVMRMTGIGNVGIGTTLPGAKLEVNGSLKATSFNGNTFTTGTGTLTIAAGKTLTASNTLTFTGTDSSSVAFGTGGTVTYTSNNLSVFAATTSAQLSGVLSDENTSGGYFTNPMTGAGDMIIAGASGVPARLAAGATTTILVGGGAAAPVWTTATGSGAPMRGTSPTITTSLIMSDGATLGQAAGPLMTFNDTGNYLGITGANVGIGTTTPYSNLDVSSTTGGALTLSRNDTAVTAEDTIGQLSFHTNDTQTTTNPLAAQIGVLAKSTITTDINPGILTFSTTPSDVGAALAERMRIDETGNVGIGTTSPSERVEIAGGNLRVWNDSVLGNEQLTGWTNGGTYVYETFTSSGSDITSAVNTTTTGGCYSNAIAVKAGQLYKVTFTHTQNSGTLPAFRVGTNTALSIYILTQNVTAGSNTIYFYAATTTTYYVGFFTASGVATDFSDTSFSVKPVVGGNVMASGQFTGGGTDGIKIDAGGNVGIGTTSPGYKLDVQTGSAEGYVVTATGAWGNSSDVRLKKNIEPMGSALDTVMALNPVTYNMNTESNSDPVHMGFIAQDVEKLAPDLVSKGSNGYMGLSYAMFTPMLTKAIQEQQGEISGLTNQTSALNLNISQTAQSTSDLQAAVNEKLSVVSGEIADINSNLASGSKAFADIRTQLADAQTRTSDRRGQCCDFRVSDQRHLVLDD